MHFCSKVSALTDPKRLLEFLLLLIKKIEKWILEFQILSIGRLKKKMTRSPHFSLNVDGTGGNTFSYINVNAAEKGNQLLKWISSNEHKKKKISVSLDPRSSLGFSWWSQMAVEKGTIQHGCCILSCNIFFKSVDIYRFPCLQWCQKKKKQLKKKTTIILINRHVASLIQTE